MCTIHIKKVKMNYKNLLVAFALITFSFIAKAQTDEFYYYNPVVPRSLPDPTLIKGTDGYFYLYATEDIHNVPIYKSKNLVNWTFVHTAFMDNTRPTFVSGGGIWAPDINYVNGQYVMYYSMSTWGGEWTCGIGVATAARPYSYFIDKGKLFISSEFEYKTVLTHSSLRRLMALSIYSGAHFVESMVYNFQTTAFL